MVDMQVQRYVTTDNGFGGTKKEWVDHLVVNGVIDMLSGDEVLAADKLGRSSSHILIMFDIVDIKREDRIISNDEQYRVAYVDNPMGMNRQLEISLEWELTL